MPPPKGVGVVAVECNGYNANRGTGWVSLSNSEAAKPHVVEFEPNRTGLHVVEVSEQTSKIKKISGQRASERASERTSKRTSKRTAEDEADSYFSHTATTTNAPTIE